MNNNLIKEINASQIKHDVTEFNSGDTITVYVRIIENQKERLQAFTGVVLQRRGSGINASFTVRKISSGVGVERTFPINSPVVSKIEVIKKGKVRRNKLFYLRKRAGKAARIKEVL